ncbi:MAG: prohibitin family protein [Elusimicrobiota bacterium]|jgi:regulator of protease activity HflC (stomatin/prohibitin superfamily)
MVNWNENEPDPKEFINRNGRALLTGAGVFLAAMFLWSCVVFIPAGHEGVLFNKLSGKVSATTLKQGWQLRVPVITNVVVYDCRRKAYTMSMTTVDAEREGANTNWSPTADGNAVGIDITVWYRIPQDTAGKVYLKLGNQQWCEEQVIRPIIRNAVRLTVAKYTAPELYGPKRTDVQDKIKELIDKSFKDDSFFVLDGDGVFLRDVHLTASYQRSIEEKVAAQQTIQRKQFEVEQAKQEALAIKIKNDALASAKSYLQLRTIEMLEKKDFKVMVVPQSQGLILNLQDSK